MESRVETPAVADHPNARLIRTLYQALGAHDHRAAADCYADNARFEDIAFRLDGRPAILRMWRLVCSVPLEVTIGPITADDETGRGSWVAVYPPVMGGKKRKQDRSCYVTNPTTSTFRFAGGRIIDHRDDCDARAWAAQAFPFPVSLAMGNVEPLRRLMASSKLWLHDRRQPD